MKEVALIGPTASGKSALAIETALETDAYILSLDSLSIYKEIDIVSAKPTKEELSQVKHFGIDLLYPNQSFSVDAFIDLYLKAKEKAQRKNKNLIIVGGTLFYLKSLLTGLSPIPRFSQEILNHVKSLMNNLDRAYKTLNEIDPIYSQRFTKGDRYRIEKGLLLYFQTGLRPTDYFYKHPPKPIIESIPIFTLEVDREDLRKKIAKRTKKMIQNGLIDEIFYLERKYTRSCSPMKAIGIVETLDYLDGKMSLDQLEEKITINTAKLAKRQRTFIKTQFRDVITIDPCQKAQIIKALSP